MIRALLMGLLIAVPACALDLTPYNALLGKFVNADGAVDYAAWRADAASVTALDAFLIQVGAENVAALPTAADAQAFWVNVHNAFVLRTVLQRPGLKSPFDDPKFYTHTDYSAGGGRISLQSIVNDKIRAQFHEPRLIFALGFGCKGGPKLRTAAYTAVDFPASLDQLAKDFLADPTKNRFDKVTTTAILSEVFHWYLGDYGGAKGVFTFIDPLAPPSAAEVLDDPDVDLQFTFNRTLNQLGF